MTHEPLRSEDASVLDREVTGSKAVLEDIAGTPVTSFAYPYGAEPTAAAAALVAATYNAACTTAVGVVGPASDPYALPRIDAHYVRRADLLRAALDGSLKRYLAVRGTASRLRRLVRADYDRASGR